MTQQTDTLIVGGGVIGCALAYELAKAGVKTIVIDKDALGSQSTRAGAGMLGAQVEMDAPGPLYDLGIRSRALFAGWREELLDLSGIDIELQTAGICRVAVDEADRLALLERAKWQQAAGQRAEWLEEDQFRKEVGGQLQSQYGALYLPDDHQVRNPQLLHALVHSAMHYGADFREATAMTGFLMANGAVQGVMTLNGPIRADRVVIASGAWTGLLTDSLSLNIPVFPVKGQAFFLDTFAAPNPYTIFTHGCYILPKRNGQIYVGATEEHAGFDRRPNLGSLAKLSSQAVALMPSLGSLPFAQTIAGLRPGSPDGLPFLGPVPGIGGLYIASGHFRNGVLLAPITAQVMTDVLTGRETSVHLEPFAAGRMLQSAAAT